MEEEQQQKPTPAPAPVAKATTAANVPDGKLRNGLIFGTLGVAAAIIFGLLYLFVIAPSAPAEGAGWSVGWFLFSFATGLTMIVMPCTLPLAFVIVPLSMGKGLVKGLGMAIAFGLGVAATLSLYGVAAAVVGAFAIDSLGAPLEVVKNWVYLIAGIFALIFALSEIGLLNFHMPTYSGAAPAFIQKRQEVFKAFLLGLFLGNIGVGCPHPATPLLLIEIASSGDILYGWLMFLVHAVGRVLPLLLLAFLAILGVNGLNWLMTRKDTIERVTGWAMVFVAGFILTLGLFTHDWWVNSGIHTALEAVTQESYFNTLLNDTLDQAVAHNHGLEEGQGLFGLPLWLGHWFLVFVWLLPIWWWWSKKRKKLLAHPSYKLKALEKEIDILEKDRRQVESMVNLDEIETSFDLSTRHTQLDALEAERRKAEEHVQYGETGDLKSPIAQDYEYKVLKMHRNYLFAISIFLALTFIYFMPSNFYWKSQGGGDHHAPAATIDPAGPIAGEQNLIGLHVMADGTVMNTAGEVVAGVHMMPDGSFMKADGSVIGSNGERAPIAGGTIFTKDTAGLPFANAPELVELADGDSYDITASYVQNEIGNRTLRMLAYNGSVPGPFIKAEQGSEITINFTNQTDIDQTIHSHGIRIDNNSDGVPYVTQDPVLPGESYTYTIKFADAGVYWYHPHTRDDYGQEMGLYGNYLVDPPENDYWSSVNREVPLVIDDILIENDKIVDFYKEFTNFALLGRFGNEFLVNGETDFTMTARAGEVIRFFVTNVSNARPYNFSLPGAKMKLVGADLGRFEREEFVDNFIISPAERIVVEAYFDESGTYKLLNSFGGNEYEMARILVTNDLVTTSYLGEFNIARQNQDVIDEFTSFRSYINREPDKKLLLTVDLSQAPVIDHSMHTGHAHDTTGVTTPAPPKSRDESIQWDDPGGSDYVNTSEFVWWQLIDQNTGRISMDIPVADWTFKEGDLVKIRLTNDANADHVMQHPIHLHGQQFVILEENGVPNQNMAWKDTVLVYPGEVVDILVNMANLGEWMSHCHISEHLHAGMMLQFRVEDEDGYATGDEYRSTVDSSMTHMSTPSGSGTQTGSMNMGQMTNTSLPIPGEYSYGDAVSNGGFFVTANTQSAAVGVDTQITLTFSDSQGNTMVLDDTLDRALSVTFVNSDNSVRFATYPGNTVFPEPVAPVAPPNQNVPGAPGFDESMPHSHSFNWIPLAYAHGGVEDGHVVEGGRTYTVPVKFPDAGTYRGFVEYTLAGETNPRVTTFDIEVGNDSFNINNFGWSKTTQWWVLLIVSLLLMVPLVFGVRKYINVKQV